MSAQSNSRKRGWLPSDSRSVVLIVIIVALTVLVLYLINREDSAASTRGVDTSDGISTHEAEIVMERAKDAADMAGNLLSLMEVTLGAISIGVGLGVWMLRGMIMDQIDEARELNLRADTQLKQNEERFEQLRQELMNNAVHMRASFRVLSLQLLAEQQVRAHNIDTAIDTLQTAHALNADDHATNYLLGYLYISHKEIDLAIKHLEHALNLEPSFTPGIAALGLALRRKGDSIDAAERRTERDRYWAQAETNLLEALDKDSKLTDTDGESYYGTLGGLYRRQKRYDAALDAYEHAHHVTPHSSYPIINLATLSKHQGDDENAAHYFEQVIKQALLQLDDDPRDVWTRCDLAQARLVLGDKAEALREFQIVIGQKPERGVLDTVRDGLQFLAEAPQDIPGLDQIIHLIDTTH